MATDTSISPAPSTPPPDDEALFREARRLRRRRWAIGTLIVAGLIGAIAAIVALTSARGAPREAQGAGSAGVLPNGPLATLHVAGALTVARDGALYVTDLVGSGYAHGGQRVLVRLPDGRFRVVAGTGRSGFSGDGGPAVRARLVSVTDLVLAPDGTLYLADGGRIRTVDRDGVIKTIAGNGRAPRQGQLIANGTRALSAALGSTSTHPQSAGGLSNPLSIALSPTTGQLYISTTQQILRLTATGRLDTVRAVVPSGLTRGPLNGIGRIAIDRHGNIDIGGLDRGWSIWQVTPDGTAHYIAYGRQTGGDYPVVEPGPSGAIYAGSGGGIERIEPHKLLTAFSFTKRLHGQYFGVTYFAFSANGTLYADDVPGNIGFESHQQLLSVSQGYTRLLWQENNSRSK